MILFPEWFLELLIIGSLILTGLSTLALLLMLGLDLKNQTTW